ncbi:MAG: Eco57I restriction-modification methylase domain-containing protein [Candidatus Poribacteria bacterium]|nr:Eco57I restriction-modification methylase domain-containing protein [Candidatus Poribacteria bacterium]
MIVFECPAIETDGRIPDYATRRKIQKQVARSAHEHFIIYTDADKTTQIWQWVKREQGKPDACREHRYNSNEHSGESLIQKLRDIVFTLDEEEELGLFGVIGRVQTAFDVEKVTKKFYDHFKREHTAFLKFLKGVPDEDMQKWYVSVMLNRLMFIYFIQKKNFLDNNENYLHAKLVRSQANGTNRYYKDFLCPLFFEGFAKPENERSREMKRLLGKIPYLNGGIFQKHQLETLHGENIEIPDKAFEQIFKFFEQYQWHLDDRPLRNDNEINPDVLGYIFEKYISQKQMGAYYTKEDITEYISKNTIIPFLFDKAKKACKIAFEGEASVWQLLQADPNRYIYDAVKKGVDLDLPAEIAAGINNVSKRTDWNALADSDCALPTEIWRETVARRQRYETVRAKLANGEIDNINDLITYNLNIRQFAQDVIENCEGPELLRAFWKAITEVTILDPTCGSGAFLFAALNILEPLYEACLDRMQVFLDEVGDNSESRQSRKYNDFCNILADIKQHPNRKYFILKSIIINNLYGVDIMDEAIEICKLRLFLKMVAQIEDVKRIEPLPDIDFNVQAGNTLVGYATYDAVKKAIESKLDFDDAMARIQEQTEDFDRLFTLFRQQQTELGGDVTLADKQVLQDKLQELEDELNLYLAGEYQVDPNKKPAYQNWLTSHKPFHWFIAFYGILTGGGFDVIIGNPPYKEYREVKKQYTVKGYETEKCGNLYAMVWELVLNLSSSGYIGFIVPAAAVCTDGFTPLRNLLTTAGELAISSYGDNPGNLFKGIPHSRLSIIL